MSSSNQSRDVFDCPASCHRRSMFCTFAFRSREVRLLLTEYDRYFIAVFLSGRVQRVVVDGVRSENVSVVAGVSQGSVLGLLLFLLYTRDLPIILENILVGCVDDFTLLAEVPEPRSRVQAVLSPKCELASIGDFCKR